MKGEIMTSKELLYIDDSLSHLENIDKFIDIACESSADDKICNKLETIRKKDIEIYNSFCKLLK